VFFLQDITVAIVGKDQPFTILSNKDSAKHVAIAKENDNDTPRNDDDDDRPSPPEEPAAGPRDPEVLVATEQRP